MKYIERSLGSVLTPKLLGTYEMELNPVIEEVISSSVHHIIDVGAAEGYYAVGMTRAMPRCRTTAFEATGTERLRELALLNGVAERISAHPMCDMRSLRHALSGGGPHFLIMDVEGAEGILLDPHEIGELRKTWILVEMHDVFIPGLSEMIRARFQESHEIRCVTARKRSVSDMPFAPRQFLTFCADEYYSWEMAERSPGMTWFEMRPR